MVTIFAFFGDEQDDAAGASQGSGFVVSTDGLVLTNSHVVTTAGETAGVARSARTVYVQFADGDRVPGAIVGYDPFTDVAVLRVDRAAHRLSAVPLGDSSAVVVGEPVAAIGSPFGNESSLTVGVVSATKRSIASLTSIYNVVDAIQIDAPINRGNSGGPLFDARGRVIGINAQIRTETGQNEGVGFAIPINAAKRSLEQLVAERHRPLRLRGRDDERPDPDARPPLRLPGAARRGGQRRPAEHSPAARAGIRPAVREEEFNGLNFPVGGDVIVGIDGQVVRSADDVVRLVTGLEPGQIAVFSLVRDGKRTRVAVRLGER